jgi:shikimate kinase
VRLLAATGEWELFSRRWQGFLGRSRSGVEGLWPTDHEALLTAVRVGVAAMSRRDRLGLLLPPVMIGPPCRPAVNAVVHRYSDRITAGAAVLALRSDPRGRRVADHANGGPEPVTPDALSEPVASAVGRPPGGAVGISRVGGMKPATRPVLVLVGAPGAGKTTVGRVLARRLAVSFTDVDAVIVERAGKPVADMFLEDGEDAFRALERQVVAEALATEGGVLALGGGAVLAAETRQLLREHQVVHLTVGLADGLRRTGMSTARPLLAGVNPRATFRALLEARAPLYREVATVEVDTNRRSTNQVARAVLEALGQSPSPDAPDDPDDLTDGDEDQQTAGSASAVSLPDPTVSRPG